MQFDESATVSALLASTAPLPRVADGDGLYVHFSGGVRAGKLGDDRWVIEPLWVAGAPSRSGPITKSALVNLTKQLGLEPIAFQSIHWSHGEYSAHWIPVTSEKDNLGGSPSELWSHIAFNAARSRGPTKFANELGRTPSMEGLAAFADDQDHVERLSRAISLSLRSADINIEQISEFYFERLTDGLVAGDFKGLRFASTIDQNLYAHVHSFFMHMGAARDYLGALIAHRLGFDPTSRRTDSLDGAVRSLDDTHVSSDALVKLLVEQGLIISDERGKWAISGWMKDFTRLRNQLVHQRPYGQRFMESRGAIEVKDVRIGLHRYFRPIVGEDSSQEDVFDVVLRHYRRAMLLFQDTAQQSGYDHAMLTLTDTDIVSVDPVQ